MTRKQRIAAVAAVLVLAGATGAWWLTRGATQGPAGGPAKGEVIDGVVQDGSGRRVLYWHDPMVPRERFDKPGKSPFMDMQLAPKYADEANGTGGITVPAGMAQNLGLRIGRAEVGVWGRELQALGRVAFDEHRIRVVQTRTGGFIERLYVRAVGDAVTAGQKVAEVYAPDMLAAQHELLALRTLTEVPDIEALREAARERLRLLGMNDAEIDAIEASGVARRSIGVYAPIAGVVQELGMREGAQVMPGQTLLQVAGLDRVWVLVDLPERDFARVRDGQTATIRFAALPGQEFKGKIEYVYPRLDETVRTGQVRIRLANPKGRLRPGMYAQVNLATEKREALTVPAEAVIVTGARTVVIVRENDAFRPAEVEAGAEADGRTEIFAGLKPGEEVVLSGQFLIDSEASLKGVLARLTSVAPIAEAKTDAPASTVSSTGVVKEIDPASGMVTLSHGPIPAMNWPAMTMGFKLRDPKAAAALAPGASVRFELKREPEGSDYVIESIQAETAP